MKFLQSSVERLLYIVLLLSFVFFGVFFFLDQQIANELKANQMNQEQGIKTLETENYCLVSFFLQANRTNITLNNLKICQPVVQGEVPR